jgi:hypothetical protein
VEYGCEVSFSGSDSHGGWWVVSGMMVGAVMSFGSGDTREAGRDTSEQGVNFCESGGSGK